jgi:hypothetical protein
MQVLYVIPELNHIGNLKFLPTFPLGVSCMLRRTEIVKLASSATIGRRSKFEASNSSTVKLVCCAARQQWK